MAENSLVPRGWNFLEVCQLELSRNTNSRRLGKAVRGEASHRATREMKMCSLLGASHHACRNSVLVKTQVPGRRDSLSQVLSKFLDVLCGASKESNCLGSFYFFNVPLLRPQCKCVRRLTSFLNEVISRTPTFTDIPTLSGLGIKAHRFLSPSPY